jgi:predicted tellurium resistance membrane protein TerC
MEWLAQYFTFVNDPTAWVALFTLIVLEVVLGIDNLIFISILTNRLPPEQRVSARRLGIGAALLMRLGLLATISWIVGLTAPAFTILGNEFSWRDIILIAGGLFLVWKATKEIHHSVDHEDGKDNLVGQTLQLSMGAAVFQILLLDLVFSVDSIITAVGMTDHIAIMYIAVIVAVTVMLLAVNPLSAFIEKNPTIVMLALGFLLMIGMTLIADGMGYHVPKGYIYAAMGFSALVEGLNMLQRSRKARRAKAAAGLTAGNHPKPDGGTVPASRPVAHEPHR